MPYSPHHSGAVRIIKALDFHPPLVPYILNAMLLLALGVPTEPLSKDPVLTAQLNPVPQPRARQE